MPARPPSPRELADLPYAGHLEPFSGQPAPEETHDTVLFADTMFEDANGSGSRFLECAFSDTDFTGGRYRRARFNDVWLHTVRFTGADLAETDWLDTEMTAGALAGLEMFGAELQRVVFHNCKLDSVNLRTARLKDVTFGNCLLRDVDFGGAELTDVRFPGSALDGVCLEQARLSGADLRDATSLTISAGHDALKGAVISTTQLLDLAPALAQTLGIEVRDHDRRPRESRPRERR